MQGGDSFRCHYMELRCNGLVNFVSQGRNQSTFESGWHGRWYLEGVHLIVTFCYLGEAREHRHTLFFHPFMLGQRVRPQVGQFPYVMLGAEGATPHCMLVYKDRRYIE